jgi:surface antigen
VPEVTVDIAGRGGLGDPGDDYPARLKNAPQDSLVDQWGEYNRECTSFVAWALASRNGFGMPFHDNAIGWGSDARARGYTVDSNPAPGSVAWSNAGRWGHVAYVENVSSAGIYIEEYNHDGTGHYDARTVPASTFTGYIHFSDVSEPIPTPGAGPSPRGNTPESGGGVPGAYWYTGHDLIGLLPDGNGRLTSWVPLAGPAAGTGPLDPPVWAGVGDFTGSGKSEVAWYTGHDLIGLLPDGNGRLTSWVPLAGPAAGTGPLDPPVWAGVGSFPNTNGDGTSDLR